MRQSGKAGPKRCSRGGGGPRMKACSPVSCNKVDRKQKHSSISICIYIYKTPYVETLSVKTR